MREQHRERAGAVSCEPSPASPRRRQVVGTARHFSEHEAHKHLNDAICVIVGEVRRPDPPPAHLEQKDIRLVFDVAELIWEPPTE